MKELGTNQISDYRIVKRMKNKNVYKQEFDVTKEDRKQLHQHDAFLLFFTGLSGSGKSTIANALERKLFENNIHTFSLDGDNIRRGINADLGFTEQDRKENIRRIGHISKLFVDAGVVVLASFIAPFEEDRNFIKITIGKENYTEVYVNTSVEECEKRDVKGLYKRARSGKIKNFTGISSPYEVPQKPDVVIDTINMTIEESVEYIYEKIQNKLY